MIDVAAAEAGFLAELWHQNQAWRWLLDVGRPGFPGATRGGQRGWVERFLSHNNDAHWGHGRQRGKSLGAFSVIDTTARKWTGSTIRYCALTIDTAQSILGDAMKAYLLTCPEELQPRQDGYDWIYPNPGGPKGSDGSILVVMGTDAQTFRRGRGKSKVTLDVRDEYCFYQDLDAVERALNPGLQVPGPNGLTGRTLRISTPAESEAHPSKILVDAAKAAGNYEQVETLYDNPRVDPEAIIAKEMARTGLSRQALLESSAWLREYMGIWVIETARAACPAWTDDIDAKCRREWPRPTHFHAYTGHDWGGVTGDPHAGLFGYLDFKASKLIIEHEHEKRGIDTQQLAAEWKALETEAWGERAWDGTLAGAGFFEQFTKPLPDFLKPALAKTMPAQPFLRVCDSNFQQLQKDMISLHGYALLPTAKDDKHLQVDNLNALMRQEKIIIHPRCVRLLEQVRTGLWNKTRTEWLRTVKDHLDLLDCLVYIARNVFWNNDPFPPAPPEFWGAPPKKTGLEELARGITGRKR